jgi:hypothetical protein
MTSRVGVEPATVVGASSDEENDLVLWRVTANTPQVMTFVRPGTTPRDSPRSFLTDTGCVRETPTPADPER